MTAQQLRHGFLAAAPTPLCNGEPDRRRLVSHCRYLLDHGCAGIAPLGTTGEANSLSLAQRGNIIEAIADAGFLVDQTLIGTGSPSLGDAVLLTKQAVEHGFHNVLVLPPFFYKAVPEDGLYAFFVGLVENVGCSDIRLYLYNFPQLSGVDLSLALVERLGRALGSCFAGIKDSSGNIENTEALRDSFPDLSVYASSEQYLTRNIDNGGAGCISATANITSELAAKTLDALGAERQRHQEELSEARKIIQAFPLVAAVKQLLAWANEDSGWSSLLPPLQPLTGEMAANLRQRASEPPLKNLIKNMNRERIG